MDDCLFCKITAKSIPSKPVFENPSVYAFHDISPQAPVHVLILPKKHLSGLNALTPEESALMAEVLLATKEIARQLKIGETGYRLVSNQGKDGGQTVGHLHFHLLGGRAMEWPPG